MAGVPGRGLSRGRPGDRITAGSQSPVANGTVLAFHRLAGLAGVLAERLRLPDRRHPERHAGRLQFGLRGGRTGDCRLRLAAAVHALFRAIVLRLGLPVGGRAGNRRRAARTGADLDRSCPWTSGLCLPGGGRAFRRDGLCLDHLPLRSICRPFSPVLQRVDVGPRRRVPRHGAVHRPAVLPLALSLRGDPGAAFAAFLAAPADSAREVRAVPAVRRCLPLRRHPAADDCPAARRTDCGPAAVDCRACGGAGPDRQRDAFGLGHAIVACQPAPDRPACRGDAARTVRPDEGDTATPRRPFAPPANRSSRSTNERARS